MPNRHAFEGVAMPVHYRGRPAGRAKIDGSGLITIGLFSDELIDELRDLFRTGMSEAIEIGPVLEPAVARHAPKATADLDLDEIRREWAEAKETIDLLRGALQKLGILPTPNEEDTQ